MRTLIAISVATFLLCTIPFLSVWVPAASAQDCLDYGGYPQWVGAVETPAPLSPLLNAYPNPFNPNTTLAYDLLGQAPVSLRVYDISGRVVLVLVDSEVVAGGRNETVWNGRDDRGRQVASGTYFYRLEAGAYSETKRMALN